MKLCRHACGFSASCLSRLWRVELNDQFWYVHSLPSIPQWAHHKARKERLASLPSFYSHRNTPDLWTTHSHLALHISLCILIIALHYSVHGAEVYSLRKVLAINWRWFPWYSLSLSLSLLLFSHLSYWLISPPPSHSTSPLSL